MVEAEAAYQADHGIEVVEYTGRPCATPVKQGEIPAREWVESIDRLTLRGADAVLLSCAGVQVAPVIDEIERRTGLPLLTSNQARLWWVLRALGLPEVAANCGRLLSDSVQVAVEDRMAGDDRDE